MAQVKIEDVAVSPSTETETSDVCPCPSETKKDEVDAGDSAAKPPAEPKVENNPSSTTTLTYLWLASKRWMQENDRWAPVVTFIIGLVVLVAMMSHSIPNDVWHEKNAPIEALRCIRIHYDPLTGGVECINWDIKSVPLVGARRIVPDAVDGYNEHLVELYAYDSDARFAVYTPDEFKRISVVVQNGIKNGKSVTRYEVIVTGSITNCCSKPLGHALTDRLIVATAAKDANRWRRTINEDWIQELIRTMLYNFPLIDVSMGCESRQVDLGEISLSTFFTRPVDNVVFVGKRAINVSPEVYQALVNLSNSRSWAVEQWYMLTGMSIKATVTTAMWRSGTFTLAVQLPVAKYCSRMNK